MVQLDSHIDTFIYMHRTWSGTIGLKLVNLVPMVSNLDICTKWRTMNQTFSFPLFLLLSIVTQSRSKRFTCIEGRKGEETKQNKKTNANLHFIEPKIRIDIEDWWWWWNMEHTSNDFKLIYDIIKDLLSLVRKWQFFLSCVLFCFLSSFPLSMRCCCCFWYCCIRFGSIAFNTSKPNKL